MADPGPSCYLALAGRMLAAPHVCAGGRGAALALLCGLLQAGPELLGQVGCTAGVKPLHCMTSAGPLRSLW